LLRRTDSADNSAVAAPSYPTPLITTLPSLAIELEELLVEIGESESAAQVASLQIVDRCRCGDDFRATFYTQPMPIVSYGPNHRNVLLIPQKGWLILDVVDDRIMCVEVLYRDEVKCVLDAAVP
jgi:hypothetical protein